MNVKTLVQLLATLGLSGCAASLVKVEPLDPSIKTVKMYTGSLTGDGMYKSALEKGSGKACDGKPYVVLERTRTPSTLVKAGFEIDETNNFYWVIRCEN